jgi:hypothetical protein
MKASLVALVALAACGDDAGGPRTTPLWSDGTHLRDAEGRVAVLRGINARVEGVFDVTFADGRTPLEPIPPLTAADCSRMRQLGFDLLRLPINWSGIEPVRGQYDDAYLARVDAAVACAADAGVYVVIDIHQDAYSKEIGEDGAPLWAIQPPPTMLLEGPLTDLGDRRLSAQTRMAFQTFFDPADPAGLQDAFAAMLDVVARRWAEHPAVIGFELFNEPDTGTAELEPFTARMAQVVRDAAPAKLVMFEPSAVRNFADFIPLAKAPFPVSGAVYSPHIYTFVFYADQGPFERATLDALEPSVRAAREEADAWQTPLWIGEFGAAPTDDAAHAKWIQTEELLHDRYLASNAFWVWKEDSQGSWGLFSKDATGWVERPAIISWVSRVRVARYASVPRAVEPTIAGDAVRVELSGSGSAPNLVYIPERFATTTAITCDGQARELFRDSATGLASVACGGVLEVGPQ